MQITQIRFYLAEEAPVTFKIYNLLGEVVTEVVNQRMPAGEQVVYWDGKDASGQDVASGVYFYQLTAANHISTKRMTVLK
ncbi:MAG: FlgD immunoglobulin-like domain containing protein [Candidatus Zixiibacteriota bacterium]